MSKIIHSRSLIRLHVFASFKTCMIFQQDVQDLLLNWAEHLKEASAIFIRAPSYNKTIFFGGRAAPLDNRDPRIRSLPFATRRPTFRETQRVHEVLSTIHVYGKLNYILGIITCYLLVVLHPGIINTVNIIS